MHFWQPQLPERYLEMTPDELGAAIDARRRELGDSLIILGHHYQTDEVIRHADFTGDSFKLSQLAAERVEERGAKRVIFCGVHFMAESADILTPDDVSVILPDLSAGCSMADMATYDDVCDAWDAMHESLAEQGWRGRIIPITYMNSSAAIKAFVGERGGAVCTSSNAMRVFEWAMAGGGGEEFRVPSTEFRVQSREPQSSLVHSRLGTRNSELGTPPEDIKLLFMPDQHLGRNTAAAYGYDVRTQTVVYDPKATHRGEPLGGATPEQLRDSSVILWAGHCSVHKLFRPEHCDEVRENDPEATILVHPECCKEVVDKSDLNGSTEYIIRAIEGARPGSRWVVGTEIHLVNRLAKAAKERGVHVRILSDCQCLCTTMYRIDEPHLLWVLDNLAKGKVVNRVQVHPEARKWATVALDRMLELTAPAAMAD
ncbi:MAG: quinolinate synthase subunit A [Phycisphaeraceae bacterium]|nr:MAG: quinolinate synthase subunit A [Phycisphaeraceae bacterium]